MAAQNPVSNKLLGHSESPESKALVLRVASSPSTDSAGASSVNITPSPELKAKRSKPTQRRGLCKNCNRRRVGNSKTNLCFQCDAAASAISSTQLQSPASHHMQMYSTFLYAYYNVKPPQWRESYLQQIFSLNVSSPMLSSAIETLCLAHLGSKHSDDRLIIASQTSYGRVLASLRNAISTRPDQHDRPSHREVIASILLISHHIEGIPKQNEFQENHLTHLLGGERYVDAFGPACLNLKDPFDDALLGYLRFQSFLAAVAARKKSAWNKPEWRALDKTKYWLNLMVALPNFLERADMIMAHRTSVLHQYISICRDLEAYRNALLLKLDTIIAEAPDYVNTDEFDAFNMEVEEHCYISSSSTFRSHYRRFSRPPYVIQCVTSWILCLIADCTLLRILRCNTPTVNAELERQLGVTFDDVERLAYDHAVQICRSVYYSSTFNVLAVADWICVFVEIAQTFFAEYGALSEMGWCQACLIATRVRVDRIRPSCRPTLCRVADLGPPYCNAVKYQPGHWS